MFWTGEQRRPRQTRALSASKRRAACRFSEGRDLRPGPNPGHPD
jgi:hypothetical protein